MSLSRRQTHRANFAFSRRANTSPEPTPPSLARFADHDPARGQLRATTSDGGTALGRNITSGGIVQGASVRLTDGFVDSRQA